MIDDTFNLELQPSKTHKTTLILVSLLSLIIILISSLWWLSFIVLILYYFSAKQINQQLPTKIVLQKNKQQIVFKNIITKTTNLKCSYISKNLTILKNNNKNIVIFKDSCKDISLTKLNIFLKSYDFC